MGEGARECGGTASVCVLSGMMSVGGVGARVGDTEGQVSGPCRELSSAGGPAGSVWGADGTGAGTKEESAGRERLHVSDGRGRRGAVCARLGSGVPSGRSEGYMERHIKRPDTDNDKG